MLIFRIIILEVKSRDFSQLPAAQNGTEFFRRLLRESRIERLKDSRFGRPLLDKNLFLELLLTIQQKLKDFEIMLKYIYLYIY